MAAEPPRGPTGPRPLPPTPKEAPATAIAKGALKAPPRVRHPSLHKLAARLSADLTMPNTPGELTDQISLLIAKADDPARRGMRLNQARELLDEMFVQSFFSDKDYETQQAWITSLKLNYGLLLSFTNMHKMDTPESRLLQLCEQIELHINIEIKKTEAPERSETPDIIDAADIYQRAAFRRLTWKIVKISLSILALAGLIFAARIGINNYLIKK